MGLKVVTYIIPWVLISIIHFFIQFFGNSPKFYKSAASCYTEHHFQESLSVKSCVFICPTDSHSLIPPTPLPNKETSHRNVVLSPLFLSWQTTDQHKFPTLTLHGYSHLSTHRTTAVQLVMASLLQASPKPLRATRWTAFHQPLFRQVSIYRRFTAALRQPLTECPHHPSQLVTETSLLYCSSTLPPSIYGYEMLQVWMGGEEKEMGGYTTQMDLSVQSLRFGLQPLVNTQINGTHTHSMGLLNLRALRKLFCPVDLKIVLKKYNFVSRSILKLDMAHKPIRFRVKLIWCLTSLF